MKKIVLILLLTSLFLFDDLKLFSDDCKFESPNCDWNGPFIREFSPNPPPLMCALCTLEVEYYWRRCPIGGGLQEEIKLTDIRHKTPLECSYCNKISLKNQLLNCLQVEFYHLLLGMTKGAGIITGQQLQVVGRL